jgi:hypothetical protein
MAVHLQYLLLQSSTSAVQWQTIQLQYMGALEKLGQLQVGHWQYSGSTYAVRKVV